MSSKRKLYALLIGVQSYADPRIPDLDGTLNDVAAWEALLNTYARNDFDLDIRTLTTAEKRKPTKAHIIADFQTHFSQAGPNDVIFFFFAGHGLREKTEIPAFRQVEKDGKITGYVCYDTEITRGGNEEGTILADKELRYLLHRYARPTEANILVITDCCHSEGITRTLSNRKNHLKTRRANRNAIYERAYQGFIFHEDISYKQLQAKNALESLIPITPHISLSACRDVEEAHEEYYENGQIGGFFTITLLNILKEVNGKIGYEELQNRALNRMRDAKHSPQTPRLFSFYPDPHKVHDTFLSLPAETSKFNAHVDFRPGWKEWTIHLGAIHGIPSDPDISLPPFPVYDRKNEENIYQASIKEVNPEYSIITFKGQFPPESGLYYAQIQGVSIHPVKVSIEGVNAGKTEDVKRELSLIPNFVEIIKGGKKPMYTILVSDRRYHIVAGNDSDKKDLVQSIGIGEPGALSMLTSYVKHISRWNFIKQLYNPHTKIFRDAEIGYPFFPFEISIIKYFSDGNTEERIIESRQIEMELDEMITERERTFPIANLSIRVKNIHPTKKFYIAGVYLSMNFLADAGLFPGKGQFVEPQEKIDTPKLRLAHAPYLNPNGWDESREIIKLVFCEEAFTSEMFELPPLPYPEIKDAKNIPQADQYRDIPGKKTPPKADWATLFFEIISRRPYT